MRCVGVLVALLAALPVASTVLAAEDSPESKPLTDYFPADTIVYIECPSVPDFLDKVKTTGLYALYNAPELSAMRTSLEAGQTTDAPDGNYLEILKSFRDLAASVPGGLAVGVAAAQDRMSWLAAVEIGPATAAARTFLDAVYAAEERIGRPSRKVDVAGVSMTISGLDGECSAVTRGVLFLGSRTLLETALARLETDSDAFSLSTSVSFAKACSFLAPHPAYRVYVDAAAAAKLLKSALSCATASVPAVVPSLGEISGMVDEIDTFSVEGSFRLSGVLERICVSTRSADSRLLELAGRTELDESRFGLVPRAAFFCAGSASNTRAYEESWRALLRTPQPAGSTFQSVIESLEARSGVSVERDILPHLGRASISYACLNDAPAGVSPMEGFSRVTLIELAGEKAVSDALNRLADTARQNPEILNPSPQPGAPSPFKLETATLGTLKIHYLTVQGAPMVSPAFAVYKGYLIHAAGKETVKDVVDNLIAPGPSILESSDYTRVRSALPKTVTQVAYVSLDGIVDVFYQRVLPALAGRIDAAHTAGRINFSAADIPAAYVIKQHIDGIGMSLSATGNLLDAQIYTPTGIVPVTAAVLLAAAAGTGDVAAPGRNARPEADSPRVRLEEIGRRLQLSTVERKGAFPGAITDVVPSELLQAPQDPAPGTPVDYVYVKGLTTSSPGKRILVYEREGLSPDGRNVLHVDGSVEFLSEKDFQALLESQGK